MKSQIGRSESILPISAFKCLYLLVAISSPSFSAERKPSELEEVLVTAQRRSESAQAAPLALSVLTRSQLEAQGIRGLDSIQRVIPFFLAAPSLGAPSSLNIAIRGNGPSDITPITRDGPVAIYLDGILLPRPQGLSMDLPDLERIEILRGPQGTLSGRNTTGGAVNLISRRPSGELSLEQTVGLGNYNAWNSVTRVDLPAFGNVKAKLDYIHSERDGWVRNTGPGQSDFGAVEKDGGALGLSWSPSDALTVDYHLDMSRIAQTSNYFQLELDNIGLVGAEGDRKTKTRAPIPLSPNFTYQTGHALTVSWDVSESLTFKSLTGYRHLEETEFTSYGAAAYSDGLILRSKDDQDSVSQEFNLVGTTDRLDWVGGLYYFKGYAKDATATLFSLDTFGSLPQNAGTVNTPIDPPTNVLPETGDAIPIQYVKAHNRSQAAFGQLTWTPPVWEDRLHLTAGVRYTQDKKNGSRYDAVFVPYDLNTHHWDSLFTIEYVWANGLSTYAKRSTGYRSGSVNPRSTSFAPYDPEVVTTWEAGVKSEFLGHRLRINADTFQSRFQKKQFDFPDPNNPAISETFNADRDIQMDGAELEVAFKPSAYWTLGFNYAYLHAHVPLQPNPLAAGTYRRFHITQTPEHAGSIAIDYEAERGRLGRLFGHLDITSASPSGYIEDTARADGVAHLVSVRVGIKDIIVKPGSGSLQVAGWMKNVTNEEVVVAGFQLGGSTPFFVAQAYNEPRMGGVDVTYRFH